MNGDDESRIVGCYHDSNQVTADVPKVARVTVRISVDLHWIRDDPEHLALRPTLPAHFILGMTTKSHTPLRAPQILSLPHLGARNADFELAAFDLGRGAIGAAVVGHGGG